MRWTKVGVISLLLVSLLLASCSPEPGPSGQEIWNKILWVGSLGFLGENDHGLVSFMRILIFILMFALLFEGSKVTGLSRNIAIVVSAVIAIMSSLFIPASVLEAIGVTYATLISIIFIGVPIIGGLLVFRMIPGTSRGWIALRIVILAILLTILYSIQYYAFTEVEVAKTFLS